MTREQFCIACRHELVRGDHDAACIIGRSFPGQTHMLDLRMQDAGEAIGEALRGEYERVQRVVNRMMGRT